MASPASAESTAPPCEDSVEGVLIDEASVRAACDALQLTKPLPHQELSIARMLSVFVNHRLPVPASAQAASASPALRRLASALARAPAFGFLLTDGMGMGKTFQAIATAVILLRAEFEGSQTSTPRATPSNHSMKRVLVVLNSALIATWCEQIARHWRTVNVRTDVFVYSGSGRLAKLQASRACFVFTTYETLRADANREDDVGGVEKRGGGGGGGGMREEASVFHTIPWSLVILDEVHKARNGRRSSTNSAGSGLWRTLRRFPAHVPKLGLTGTPVCNHMMELCSIAQVVFKDHPVLSSEEFWSEYETRFTEDVVATLRASMLLRRTLASEGIVLPPRTDIDIPIVLAEDEKIAYRDAHAVMEAALSELINASERHAPPFVMKQARDRYASAVNTMGRVVCGHTKRDEVVRICKRVCEGDEGAAPQRDRIVVVSRFVSVLEGLRAALQAEAPALRCAMFTGALDWKARGAVVDAFRAREVEVVLLSTMAGNEGVDFSCAQHLVLVDSASASNPMTHEDQVVARIYRIGQTKPSFIHRLIAVGTVDDAFAFELHAQKRANAAALLDMRVRVRGADGGDESSDEEGGGREGVTGGGAGAGGRESMFRKVSSTADLLRRALASLDSAS